MLRAMTVPVAHVLVVEDEAAIAETVLYALRSEGYAASHCLLGGEALQRLQAGDIDVVVLDVGLPDLGGFEVCRRLRAQAGPAAQLPVIFLTARSDEIDRIVGLEIGADDYVTKPFSPRELVARIRVILRRAGAAQAPRETGMTIAAGTAEPAPACFELRALEARVLFHGQPLALTRYEYLLLKTLLEHPGHVLSRAQLMERVWSGAPDTLDRTVDAHVKSLRAKLRAVDAHSDPIHTHRGLGYSLARA